MNLRDPYCPALPLIPTLDRDTNISDAVVRYLEDHVDNKHTRRGYAKSLRDMTEIVGDRPLGEVTAFHLAEYRAYIMGDHRGEASHAAALIATRSFMSWASALGGHDLRVDQIKYILRVPKVLVIRPHLTLHRGEIKSLLDAARVMGLRECALLTVALGSGLRLSELIHLDCTDLIDDAEGGTTIHVRHGKGAKDRLVPVRKEVRKAVEKYLEAADRRLGDPSPLFWSEDRAIVARESWRLSTKTASAIIREAADRANLRKRVSPHALRHTFAVNCYLYSNGDIVAVSKLLGHSSIKTTMRYVDHLNLLDLRKAIPPYLAGGRGPMRRQIKAA